MWETSWLEKKTRDSQRRIYNSCQPFWTI
jgi:hypothetical protein